MIDCAMLDRLITQTADASKVSPWNYDRSMITLTPEEMLRLARAIWSEAVASEKAK